MKVSINTMGLCLVAWYSYVLVGCDPKEEINNVDTEPLKHYSMINRIDELPKYQQVDYYIKKYSKEYNVPYEVAITLARIETGYRPTEEYNPHRVSPAGALGPMQVMLSTARYLKSDNTITKEDLLYDIELNVECGMLYLSKMNERYGNWELVAISYNGGPGRANSMLHAYTTDNPDKYFYKLPKETVGYVRKYRNYLGS